MSHFSRVATKINDLDALKQALDRLKWTYRPNALVRGYAGQSLRADLSIDLGIYDVGVVPADARDGTYTLVADWWGIEHTRRMREADVVAEINREYALARVVRACEAEGYQIEDIEVQADGGLAVVAARWS